MAVYSSTGTKLLAALAVSTACLWSVGTVVSDLLSRNDVSIHRSAIAKSERGHGTLAHWTAAKAKPPPSRKNPFVDGHGAAGNGQNLRPGFPVHLGQSYIAAATVIAAEAAPAEGLNWFRQHPALTTEGQTRQISALIASVAKANLAATRRRR